MILSLLRLQQLLRRHSLNALSLSLSLPPQGVFSLLTAAGNIAPVLVGALAGGQVTPLHWTYNMPPSSSLHTIAPLPLWPPPLTNVLAPSYLTLIFTLPYVYSNPISSPLDSSHLFSFRLVSTHRLVHACSWDRLHWETCWSTRSAVRTYSQVCSSLHTSLLMHAVVVVACRCCMLSL